MTWYELVGVAALGGLVAGATLEGLQELFRWMRRGRARKKQIRRLREILEGWRRAVVDLPMVTLDLPGFDAEQQAEMQKNIDADGRRRLFWRRFVWEVGHALEGDSNLLKYEERLAVQMSTTDFDEQFGPTASSLQGDGLRQVYLSQFLVLERLEWLGMSPYEKQA